MNKVIIDFLDFEKDKYIVVNTILKHINDSENRDYQWTIARVGWDKLKEIKGFDASDLLYIEIDMNLVRGAISTLISDHKFIENEEFRTENSYDGVGALLIY